jgi:DNA replication protein DnaC
LVLIGGRPRDRTHLVSAIGNYRRAQGENPLQVRVLDLLSELRRAVGDGGAEYYEMKQGIRDCPLLLLEDLEVGKGTTWGRDELSQLLDHRCLAHLPTVITTPNTLTNLLTDPGWERLARLLSDPSFCSDVLVGESAGAEEPVEAEASPEPRGRSSSKRKGRAPAA